MQWEFLFTEEHSRKDTPEGSSLPGWASDLPGKGVVAAHWKVENLSGIPGGRAGPLSLDSVHEGHRWAKGVRSALGSGPGAALPESGGLWETALQVWGKLRLETGGYREREVGGHRHRRWPGACELCVGRIATR